MSLIKLPKAREFERPQGYQWEVPSQVLQSWAARPLAADDGDEDNVITMFDVIGQDFWTGGGVTAKRVSAALRAIGKKDARVRVNSPGGDVFEGLAIFNLLRAHPARVTVEVMGWAASAASIIAMAGDEIVMGLGTTMMVHNCWALVVGNRHDLGKEVAVLESIDGNMADIYEARTGLGQDDIVKLMDDETWLNATQAVDKGFADRVDDALAAKEAEAAAGAPVQARRQLDALLASQGVPRSERRRLLREATGMHDAAEEAMPGAGLSASDMAAMRRLIETLTI